MFSLFKKAPKQKPIDLSKLTSANLEYFCSAEFIELMILEKQNDAKWADKLVNFLDNPPLSYFVVLTNKTYYMVPGIEFRPVIILQGLKTHLGSPMAQECLEHYIKSIDDLSQLGSNPNVSLNDRCKPVGNRAIDWRKWI